MRHPDIFPMLLNFTCSINPMSFYAWRNPILSSRRSHLSEINQGTFIPQCGYYSGYYYQGGCVRRVGVGCPATPGLYQRQRTVFLHVHTYTNSRSPFAISTLHRLLRLITSVRLLNGHSTNSITIPSSIIAMIPRTLTCLISPV